MGPLPLRPLTQTPYVGIGLDVLLESPRVIPPELGACADRKRGFPRLVRIAGGYIYRLVNKKGSAIFPIHRGETNLAHVTHVDDHRLDLDQLIHGSLTFLRHS